MVQATKASLNVTSNATSVTPTVPTSSSLFNVTRVSSNSTQLESRPTNNPGGMSNRAFKKMSSTKGQTRQTFEATYPPRSTRTKTQTQRAQTEGARRTQQRETSAAAEKEAAQKVSTPTSGALESSASSAPKEANLRSRKTPLPTKGPSTHKGNHEGARSKNGQNPRPSGKKLHFPAGASSEPRNRHARDVAQTGSSTTSTTATTTLAPKTKHSDQAKLSAGTVICGAETTGSGSSETVTKYHTFKPELNSNKTVTAAEAEAACNKMKAATTESSCRALQKKYCNYNFAHVDTSNHTECESVKNYEQANQNYATENLVCTPPTTTTTAATTAESTPDFRDTGVFNLLATLATHITCTLSGALGFYKFNQLRGKSETDTDIEKRAGQSRTTYQPSKSKIKLNNEEERTLIPKNKEKKIKSATEVIKKTNPTTEVIKEELLSLIKLALDNSDFLSHEGVFRECPDAKLHAESSTDEFIDNFLLLISLKDSRDFAINSLALRIKEHFGNCFTHKEEGYLHKRALLISNNGLSPLLNETPSSYQVIISLMSILSMHSDLNKMNTESLIICFAPRFIRTLEFNDHDSTLKQLDAIKQMLESDIQVCLKQIKDQSQNN